MPKIDSEDWRQFREWEAMTRVELRREAFLRWEGLKALADKARAEYLDLCVAEPEKPLDGDPEK